MKVSPFKFLQQVRDEGQKVTWRWVKTTQDHNVTGKGFHSASKDSGTYSHKFNKRGTFTVICTIHPTQMRMKVVVK